MKAYKKITVALIFILATSCSLDLQEDPNAVQLEKVLPSLQLNSIQRQLPALFNGASGSGGQMTRLLNGGGSLYQNATTPETFNGIWSTAYAGILQDAGALLKVADANGFARHAGMTRVIQAYTLVMMADMFGDVPFKEAFQGAGNFNPKADPGDTIYNRALKMLDRAKLDLTTPTTTSIPAGYQNPVAPVISDMYYGPIPSAASYNKWVRLANTLKLKIYLNLSLKNKTLAETQISAILADVSATGGIIQAADQSFIWRYGTNTADPDARHPRFVGQYPGGGGDYQSNWLMWHMFHAYDAVNTTVPAGAAPGDPRMRFYFARQTTSNSSSTNELRCLGENTPDHYPSATVSGIIDNPTAQRPPMGVGVNHPTNDPTDLAWARTFCTPTDRGYWGRDHVDPQGIPQDGTLRTAYGAYPVGGRFDNNVGGAVSQTQGMRGAGIQPMLMRSHVQFMLAEASLTLTITAPSSARTYYQNGITYSFDDVRAWAVGGTLGTSAVIASTNQATTINTFYPLANYNTNRDSYIASALAAYDNRLAVSNDEAMNYVAREFWVALFGNGYEAYNMYRRTGKPSGMQPVINPTPGNFPRSFWYPANFADLNNSVDQKADLTVRVFWDNNQTNLNF